MELVVDVEPEINVTHVDQCCWQNLLLLLGSKLEISLYTQTGFCGPS